MSVGPLCFQTPLSSLCILQGYSHRPAANETRYKLDILSRFVFVLYWQLSKQLFFTIALKFLRLQVWWFVLEPTGKSTRQPYWWQFRMPNYSVLGIPKLLSSHFIFIFVFLQLCYIICKIATVINKVQYLGYWCANFPTEM